MSDVGFLSNFLGRIKQALPPWYADADIVRDAILSSPAEMLAWAYKLLAYVKVQTRLATSTDIWLDMFAADYFGPNGLLRKAGEQDANYENRIQKSLFAPRGTRAAMVQALTNLTGSPPKIFEPHFSLDTGGWGGGNNHVWSGLAYGAAGGYGGASSTGRPFQAFITVTRPTQFSVPNIAGYGVPVGAYGIGAIEYSGPQATAATVSDADIYAEVAKTMPASSIGWTAITG